jgi:hypothetical protein
LTAIEQAKLMSAQSLKNFPEVAGDPSHPYYAVVYVEGYIEVFANLYRHEGCGGGGFGGSCLDDFTEVNPPLDMSLNGSHLMDLGVVDPNLAGLSGRLAETTTDLLAHSRALNEGLVKHEAALDAGDPLASTISSTFQGGIRDDFAGSYEATSIHPELEAALGCSLGAKGFDDPTPNRCFGHSLTGLPTGITQGTFEIRIRNWGGNDKLYFRGAGGSPLWAHTISTLPSIDGSLPTGSDAVITLDVSSLPNEDGTTSNLVPTLNSLRRLDLIVQDDTTIDYVSLNVQYTPPLPITYSEVQRQSVLALIEDIRGFELEFSDQMLALSESPVFQSEMVTYEDVIAFQDHLETIGLPAVELAFLEEWGVSAEVIAGVTAQEAATVIEPFEGVRSIADALAVIGAEVSAGSLSILANMPEGFPFTDIPVVNLAGGATPPCGAGCSSMELKTAGGPPIVGNATFGFEVSSTPDAGFALLWLGVGLPYSTGIPWEGGLIYAPLGAPSFWHWNQIVPVLGTTGCSGGASFPFPLPANPAWVGVPLSPQGFFVCPSGNAVPTNALSLFIQ